MAEQPCIFCTIILKKIPAQFIDENEHCIIIQDIAPKAPIHYLIIPKKHIENVHHLIKNDAYLLGEMGLAAQKIAQTLSGEKAFGLIMNNGAQAGQRVMHMHMHFLSGAKLTDL